jgi:ketosteroid isomerase-like protein
MDPRSIVETLRQAVDAHDLEALVSCFAVDYRNETPVHPARGFVGRAQVRANWERIFGGIPDVAATVLRTAVDDGAVWSEWELAGTRSDGVPQVLRGVIVFGVRVETNEISWGRFYLEPVDLSDGGVADAVDALTGDQR